jgi:hypothetical protein
VSTPALAASDSAPAPDKTVDAQSLSFLSQPSSAASDSSSTYSWEEVAPSDAIPEATEDITEFDQLVEEIETYGAIDIPLRHLIALFGAERRGRRVLARIEAELEDVGVGYSHAIELADIDSVIRLHGDGTPAQVVTSHAEE